MDAAPNRGGLHFAPWMLAAGEDAFQMVRTRSFKGFFKPQNMGVLGNAAAGARALANSGWKTGAGWRVAGMSAWRMTFPNLYNAWKFSYGGILPFMLPVAAYLGSKAGQGQEVSTAAGFMAGGLAAIPGALIAGGPGALVSSMLFSDAISKKTRGIVQHFASAYQRQTAFEFGDAKYMDTQAALTMRQAAAKEMSNSLLNARQYLGREASFLHQ